MISIYKRNEETKKNTVLNNY